MAVLQYFSYASLKTNFDSIIARPLLTINPICGGMALPFLWQMSKSVNPIVDEFIFIVKFSTVGGFFSDDFEYLSEKSIGLQNLESAGPHTVQPKLQISTLGLK